MPPARVEELHSQSAETPQMHKDTAADGTPPATELLAHQPSDKLQPFEAREAVAADDQMVVYEHIQRFAERDYLPRHLDAGTGGAWVS